MEWSVISNIITIKGKYNTATVYTNVIEEAAADQIKTLCDQEFVAGSQIRIMPDVHAGKGCVIGFTMHIQDKVVPSLVGVDIGCGINTTSLSNVNIDFNKLDSVIRQRVPFGKNVHEGRVAQFDLTQLKCYRSLKDTKRLERSIGSLGGGNHFIEVDTDQHNNKYLVIHSGSRNLGHQVATHYQKLAVDLCSGKDKMFEEQEQVIKEYKEQGRRKEIQKKLREIKSKYSNMFPPLPEDLCYLTGRYKEDYLHDMKICQQFATLNRSAMADIIISHMGFSIYGRFETVHNYINFDDNILRKGAISAHAGELLLIPINMRDGCIIGRGKGNPEWNYSAPHGAGRLMSRKQARERLDMAEFRDTMGGVFTTSVSKDTLDEAPMAYKSIDDIVDNIGDTVDVVEIIKPVYNFKASE